MNGPKKPGRSGLVLHSDNGKPMRGSTLVSTLQWLGVVPSFSRPHVSNDNLYSESPDSGKDVSVRYTHTRGKYINVLVEAND